MTSIYKNFPDELAKIYNVGGPTAKYFKLFNDTNLTTYKQPAPDPLAPAVGTFWRAALDHNVYRVVAIAQGSRSYEVVIQETDGEIFTISVADFNGRVRVISPAEDAVNQVVPRFEPVEEVPTEWKWWYPMVQKVRVWWSRLLPSVRDWTPEQVFANLHPDATTPLFIINASNTNHGQANLIFTYEGEGSRSREQAGTLYASWYPVDISHQFPRGQLRNSPSFLNLLDRKMAVIVSPARAKKIMASPEAQEEKKRMDALIEHVKEVSKVRTLEQSNVEMTSHEWSRDDADE